MIISPHSPPSDFESIRQLKREQNSLLALDNHLPGPDMVARAEIPPNRSPPPLHIPLKPLCRYPRRSGQRNHPDILA